MAATEDAGDGGFPAARRSLLAMAAGYAKARNDIMRDQAVVDIALLGLTTAAVANPIFHGARAATIGLGLGAGALGAGKVYFAPQSRVSLYNDAAASLACAAGVADEMAGWYAASFDSLTAARRDLEDGVAAASALLTGRDRAGATGDAGVQLLAARDAATAALVQTRLALAALQGGAGRLRAFSFAVAIATTRRVVAGTQDVSGALAKITALAPAASAAAGAPAAPPPHGLRTALSVPELTFDLGSKAIEAVDLAGPINDSWSGLVACGPAR